MNTRRCGSEVIADILESARNGINVTRLLQDVNLSYIRLMEYVSMLKRFGLVLESEAFYKKDRMRLFKTTQKGVKFLEAFERLKEILKK